MKNKHRLIVTLAVSVGLTPFVNARGINTPNVPIPQMGQPMAAPVVPQINRNQYNYNNGNAQMNNNMSRHTNPYNRTNTGGVLVREHRLSQSKQCNYSNGQTRYVNLHNMCPRNIN